MAALSSFRPSLAWFFFFFAFAQHSSHFVCLIRFTFLRRGTKYFLRSFFVLRYPFYIAYTHILVLDSHFIMHLLRRLGLPRFFWDFLRWKSALRMRPVGRASRFCGCCICYFANLLQIFTYDLLSELRSLPSSQQLEVGHNILGHSAIPL